MTAMKFRQKPVWHATGCVDGSTGRTILAAESPAAVLIRLKGCRQTMRLPWTLAYLRAATLEAQVERVQRINRRRAIRRGALA